jgi:hypothetical protein
VETIVYHAMTTFEIKDLDIGKYLLKIHGLEEYIETSCILGELKYINDCFNESREPVFVLVHIRNANIELSKKSRSTNDNDDDDQVTNNSTAEHDNDEINEFRSVNPHLVSRSKVDTLVRALIQYRNLIEEAIDELNAKLNATTNANMQSVSGQFEKLSNWLVNYREKMRCFQSMVFSVNYELVDVCVRSIEILERRLNLLKEKRGASERQPLIMSMVNKDLEFSQYDYKINVGNGLGSGGELNDEVSVFSAINDLINNSMRAVCMFVNCAASSFNWKFKLKMVFEKTANDNSPADDNNNNNHSNRTDEAAHKVNFQDIIQAEEKFALNFYGLSRLNALINSLVSVLK